MANYDFYLAKSKHSISNPGTGKMGFHFRSEIIQDANSSTAPFLKLDTAQSDPITVSIETVNGKTHYTLDVQLVEVSVQGGLPSEDYVFYHDTPLNYANLVGKVTTHVKKSDGSVATTAHGGDLLYPEMPEEYPVDE